MDQHWRLNNLYWIQDKNANQVKFRVNWAQLILYNSLWHFNVILKARQLGITTFFCIYMLDKCVFEPNQRAGVIAHDLKSAIEIFRTKVKYPWDYIARDMPQTRKYILEANNLKMDQGKQLTWGNDSSLFVGLSMRSGTLNMLLISEYGRICAKTPEKAKEIKEGALNTVGENQLIAVESTAEGQAGHFFTLSERAQTLQRTKEPLTYLDPNFFFFPWWKEPTYRLPVLGKLRLSEEDLLYFHQVEQEIGQMLDQEQRHWYVKKRANLEDDQGKEEHISMKKEYPSTPREAFEQSVLGAFYTRQIERMEREGRYGYYPHNPLLKVHVSFDIGTDDVTAMTFWQIQHGKRVVIDYYENAHMGSMHYFKYMKKKDEYRYGRLIFPHDIKVEEWGSGITRQERAEDICRQEGWEYHMVERCENIMDDIEFIRTQFHTVMIDSTHGATMMKGLRGYTKVYDDKLMTWRDYPKKNWARNPADSYRYGIIGTMDLLHRDRYLPTDVESDYVESDDYRGDYGLQQEVIL